MERWLHYTESCLGRLFARFTFVLKLVLLPLLVLALVLRSAAIIIMQKTLGHYFYRKEIYIRFHGSCSSNIFIIFER